MDTVEINDAFWNARIQATREGTLPAIHNQLKETGRWDAFKLTWKPGEPNQPHYFWDSDVAKFVEGLCYAMGHMDPSSTLYTTYTRWTEEAIEMIGKAQADDGYINIYFTVVEPGKRWTNVMQKHEMYCAGHLLEAAIAHYSLTEKTTFLDIMCRYMDHIDSVFGPEEGKKHGYPGHEELELSLLKLYAVRPDKKYVKLAQYFIEQRGHNNAEFYQKETRDRGEDPDKQHKNEGVTAWPDTSSYWYMQAEDHVRDLQKIRGHSVRAMYYLTAVQHLANISNDKTLDLAVQRLWRNMVDTKFYIHGGIGAIDEWEGFGEDYELPLKCYSETCASVGILFLGRRMLQRKLEGEVARVMERALYNNVLGGMSLDGRSFFYDQPLEASGIKRSEWFSVSCCPPNVSRILNELEDYLFTTTDSMVTVNFFIGAQYNRSGVRLQLTTEYPWKGKLSVSLYSDHPVAFAVRRPASKLDSSLEYTEKDGYLIYKARKWNDILQLAWNTAPKIVLPNPKVDAIKGLLAIQRGPFVYAVEQMDSNVPIDTISISRGASFEEKMTTINGVEVCALHTLVDGHDIQFLPYFCWGNRHPGEKMQVYVKQK